MKRAPLLSIIITDYNAKRWLDKCILSIKAQKFRNYEIVFVNDGSTDGSFEYVQKKYPECVFINNIKNIGFALSNNAGATAATGEYLFILNADTHLEKNTLEKIAAYVRKHPDRHLLQLDIRRYDKSNLKGEACTFDMDFLGYPIWSGREDSIFYADAAAMVIKKDLFFKLHGFDDAFYIYLEDMDIAWRARMLGHNVYLLAKAYVYHFAGGTSVSTQLKEGKYTTSLRRRYDAQKNNLRAILKNYELKNVLWILPFSVFLAVAEGWLYLIRFNMHGFLALHKAILWNIVNIHGTLKERAYMQTIRTVPDSEILAVCSRKVSKVQSFFTHGVPAMKI